MTEQTSPVPTTGTPAPAALRVPPHSIEAEQAVIGGILIDNTAWDAAYERIREEDFYRQEHRLIFKAMDDLITRNQPVDVVTLADTLKNMALLDQAGGEVYLWELSKNTPTAANMAAYADIVRAHSVQRQLISAAGNISELAFNPQGRRTADLLDEAEKSVFGIAEQNMRGSGPVQLKDLVTKAVERIDTLYQSDLPVTGLATGYKDFDQMTSGMQNSDLVIIAGRPSMGKTTFAVNIAEHVAIELNKPVLVFSMEMPGDSLAMRMMSSLGRIDQHRLRTGKLHDEDWPRVSSAVSLLSEAPMFIDDTPGLSPAEMRNRARRMVREHGQLGMIVIDYLQLMHVPGSKEGRVGEISEISRSLKALAKELNVPVLALSQLNRSLEQRSDRRPIMSDLRESGAIEQDADLIVFIYRDEVYHEDSRDKGVAEIIIGKQRNGPIGKVRLAFLGQYTRFEDLSPEYYNQQGLPA